MTRYTQHSILGALVLALLTATTASAQTPSSFWEPPPQECKVIKCVGTPGARGDIGPAGPRGADGRNGTNGRDGRDGLNAPQGPRTGRAFDLGAHGFNVLDVSAVVQDGVKTYMIVYEPTLRIAALVDIDTGLGQVATNFTAGVTTTDPRGPLVFDGVMVLRPRQFLWKHRGAGWAANWDETLPWQVIPLYFPR